METVLTDFRKKVSNAIDRAFGDVLSKEERMADMAPCMQEGFGHYQCNSALALSKVLKQNPRSVAEKIIEHFDARDCARVEIAGPGFINFTLSPAYLSAALNAHLKSRYLGAVPPAKRQRVIVEFSSPNIAKELHVGHVRSTIIGDCLARLFEFLDQDVLRLNHLGDWGTQFGMLIAYLKENHPALLTGEEKMTLELLMQWYKAAKKQFDEDPAFKKRSQHEVVLLQAGDKHALFAWRLMCDVSRTGFQEIYDLMDVRLTERGESFYNPFLKEVIDELDRKKLITLSDGAKCVYLDGFKGREGEPLPVIVQKSDGGYNYDTTDLAAIRHRIFIEKADRIIYVTDQGQSLHFQMVFAVAEKAGWLDPAKVKVDHVGFGLVLGSDGKKFKTRSGDTEKLIDLLFGAIDKARAILQERHPDADPKEIDHLARVLGVSAVKYADLSSLRTKDYTFSYDRMLRFEGNTAVFLLYAYVRINGIKRKTGANMEEVLKTHQIALNHPTEMALGVHLVRFGEIIEIMARDLLPNRLTDYLYELAEKFNAFFRDCRVEGVPEEGSRLVLCELTAKVLKQGLEILGIETVNRL
ncbi:MAG: arginine--tRNA ligase, partial [Verrucomicrobia bacterium]|nr:arginine--tRNA ligase [Verrucomicrobiota bacterium]MBU6446514.1 arginine--tRNA ligase [Verrucomicrobiota bacterium]